MNFHLINIESKRLHLKNSYYEKYDERFKKIFNEIADQGYLLNTEYEFDTSNNLIIKYFLAKYNITKMIDVFILEIPIQVKLFLILKEMDIWTCQMKILKI